MPIGIIKAELRDKKDHFVTTLYKNIRNKLKIKPTSILLLRINNQEFIKMPNKDYHITIPKKLIKCNSNKVKLKISRIYDLRRGRLRNKQPFDKDDVNIDAFVPNKTIFGNEIFILNDKDYAYIWYNIGGGAKHIKIKKKFNAEKLSELIGFYFGDGNTSEGIRSFRLNNCESSTLNCCLDILEGLGIPRKFIKLQIIYSSNNEISPVTKERCINYWKKSLTLDKKQIISVNRSKNKRRTLEYGSARIFFDNSVFVEVFLHGILKEFIKIIQNPKNETEKKILKGFLRGLAAAEGGVTLTKLGSLSKIGLSYNPHTNDLQLYKKILENLGVKYGGIKGNELYIYGIKNFKILKELDLFRMHKRRNEKFLKGFKNHKFAE